MLIIRLQRVGRKNDPSFRIIVTDSHRAAKTGSVLEVLGSYDARKGQPQIMAERVKHWLANGAQVSATVHNLLVGAKLIEGKKVNVLPKNKNKAKIEAEAPAVAETVADATPVEAELQA